MMKKLLSVLLLLSLSLFLLPAASAAGGTAGDPEPNSTPHRRLAGAHRYETAFLTADHLKNALGKSAFDVVVVASGTDFADALSGSYLAARREAPILLVCDRAWINDLVKEYIKNNLNPGGTIYLLGGETAVPASFEKGLEKFQIIRLAGENRFETNLKILEEDEVGDSPILIATGGNFADSLSASAAEMPILLVWRELTPDQRAFLQQLSGNKLYILGGTATISPEIQQDLTQYGPVKRLGGESRFETSAIIAREFFENPQSAVFAYARNFPDGLTAGPLAAALNVPLLLTMTDFEEQAASYVKTAQIQTGIVLGGPSLISDASMETIFRIE